MKHTPKISNRRRGAAWRLPRHINKANVWPREATPYEISDSTTEPGELYTVTKYDKSGNVANIYSVQGWRGTVQSQALETPALPAYVLAEVERQYSADALFVELTPAKRTPGHEYDHELYRNPDPVQVAQFDYADTYQRADVAADPRGEWETITRDELTAATTAPGIIYRATAKRETSATYSRPARSVVAVVQRHVSSSGMLRALDLFTADTSRRLTYHAARVTGSTYSDKYEALMIGGCGMDMHFAAVYDLAARLYGDGYALTHRSI